MIVINFNLFKKYDVALSFAEENRAPVALVAQLLEKQGIRVFYDDDRRIDSWGKDLKKYLDKVYRLQAKFCVVFVSRDYERKRWTNFEIGRAKARSFFTQNEVYVLPYLLDESEYSEQFKDVGCLTRNTHNEHQLAEAIIRKLNRQPGRRLVMWFNEWFRNKMRRGAVITLLSGGGLFLLRDPLTPVDSLTQRIYDQNTRNVKGSVCKDGSFSPSRGQGTCSHHDGVERTVDTVIHNKTMEECRKEAESTSIW